MSDRAAVVTAAIFQIIETAPKEQRRQRVEEYLRDEFIAVAQQAVSELPAEDDDGPRL